MEPTPALPKGGSLNEAQYIYSPPLGRVGVGSSPSLWEGRGRLLCECKITTFPSPPQYSKVMLFLSKNHITHPHN